ncbi:MAG: RNA polymerase factor sigma-54 [Lachnospiraceae bacterium]|nr:RNA polymerase factor sigma-54 [Lachnospiraceae bacterium]
MNLDLSMKQTQKLVLTPQMEQSLSILQMGAQELEQCIENEILSNPMLDYEETEQEKKEKETPDREISEEYQMEYERNFYPVSRKWRQQEDDQTYINSLVDEKSCGTSLKEFLRAQLCTRKISSRRQAIGEYLIECMEDSGYLKMTSQEISCGLGITEQEAEQEIQFLQGLEPSGVFARDLRECLLLQIRCLEGDTQELYDLVENYMDQIVHNKMTKICKETGWSREKVLTLIARVKELQPVPGRGYGTKEQGTYLYPDITVREAGGDYHVILNREKMKIPKLNQEYLPLLTREKAGSDYEYMQEQYQNAKMLLKNIDRREETLYSVAEAIVRRQKNFFAMGKMYLAPMNLADIAVDLDMHESTVSRALKEKYLECRWGVFELKYFFSNKGREKNARSYIEEIVKKEDKSRPFSDAQIVRELEKMGIDISRRTVVKYREQLEIPNVMQRKEYR